MSALFEGGMDAVWIMVTGALVASACALLGCFLILRRMALMGDAISHAVLPGIVLAFLLSGTRNIVPMLVGAGAVGVLTVMLTDALAKWGRTQSDAAMGVTFTSLFALGVILVSKYTANVDLDVECVLYGEILFVPFDVLQIGDWSLGPRAAWVMGSVALADLAFVLLCWKQLKLCAFDPGLAASLGLHVTLWHYALMAAVSVTTVASFESVGVILVVAMLTAPPNTAYLLTDRLWLMTALAVCCGVISAVGGYALATWLDASIAGSMATVSGALFLLAALFAPRHGVAAKALTRRLAPLAPPKAAD